MNHMNTPIILNKGQYTGKITDIHYLKGLIVGTTLYPEETSNSPVHYHENPHISLLLQGGHVEKRLHSEFERLPGDILFCFGGEAHQFITQLFPSKNINLELEYQFLQQYEIGENDIKKAIQENIDSRASILKMYKETLIGDNLSEVTIQMLFLSVAKDFNKLANKRKPPWVLRLIEILNDRWNESPTLQELSFLTGVHPVTISKNFTRFFACTFGEYMRRIKINKSIELIRKTHLSLTDISFECGFSDQSHFIRSFKAFTGWLPGKFRKL